MLDITKKVRRRPHSYTLLPSTIDRVKELAELHDVSASRIVEALVIQYAPKLVNHIKNSAAADA